jgi:hypothetical protein
MKDIFEALQQVKTGEWDIMVFRDLDGNIAGVFTGTPEILQSIASIAEEQGAEITTVMEDAMADPRKGGPLN